MSSVIIDYMGLIHGIPDIFRQYGMSPYGYHNANEAEIQKSKQNLLTAFVLWDNIYLNSDRYAYSRSEFALNLVFDIIQSSKCDSSFIHSIDIHNFAPQHLSMMMSKQLLQSINQYYHSVGDYEKRLLIRSLNYLLQANSAGISYLPHPRRAKILSDAQVFSHGLDGLVYLDMVDRAVVDYIDAINNLSHQQLLTTSFPVLNKFISSIAKDPVDEIRVALQLRQKRDVVEFRKSVDQISEEVKKGNIEALRASLEKVREMCDDLTNSLYKKPLSVGVSLGISPSLDISREYKPKVSSNFHTTFLSNIATHAIKGHIPPDYWDI